MHHYNQKRYVLLKKQIIKFGYEFFLYVIDIMYIYSWKKIDQILIHFCDATLKK